MKKKKQRHKPRPKRRNAAMAQVTAPAKKRRNAAPRGGNNEGLKTLAASVAWQVLWERRRASAS